MERMQKGVSGIDARSDKGERDGTASQDQFTGQILGIIRSYVVFLSYFGKLTMHFVVKTQY